MDTRCMAGCRWGELRWDLATLVLTSTNWPTCRAELTRAGGYFEQQPAKDRRTRVAYDEAVRSGGIQRDWETSRGAAVLPGAKS